MNYAILLNQLDLLELNMLLQVPRVRSNLLRNWYTVRCVYLWNKLPNEIRSINPGANNRGNIDNAFKKALKNYFKSYFNENFKIHQPCTWRYWCNCNVYQLV